LKLYPTGSMFRPCQKSKGSYYVGPRPCNNQERAEDQGRSPEPHTLDAGGSRVVMLIEVYPALLPCGGGERRRVTAGIRV